MDFPEEKLEYFEELLRSDKARNLRERIDYLRAVDPEAFEKTLALLTIQWVRDRATQASHPPFPRGRVRARAADEA